VGVVDLGWVAGKRVRKTCTAATLKDLRPKFKALKQSIEDGVIPDDATVEQWMRHWLEHEVDRKLRPQTARGYRQYAENWIIPHLGKRRLDKLKPDHIEALYAAMADAGKADATRRQVHAILRRALVVAERQKKIAWNPAAKVDPPSVGKGSHGKFTLPEALAILAVLDSPGVRGSRWACALLAGLRQGEALGLRWEDVDFERNVLVIERAVQQIPGKGLQVVGLKSEKSYRAVPMVDPVRAALWAERKSSGFVFGDGEKPPAPRIDYGAWRKVLALSGVDPKPLHAARATTASLLMEAGVSEKLIAEILGHSQVIITRKHYLHGDDRMHRDAMTSLNTLLGLPTQT
jgi:integrase